MIHALEGHGGLVEVPGGTWRRILIVLSPLLFPSSHIHDSRHSLYYIFIFETVGGELLTIIRVLLDFDVFEP